eukprot:TRINITY_DN7824_c0_g1_i3.p1 TRINITY_DN7824_c0_g1~~TRINITY_DN7824_c0_g1_i3.p1  ORF type:complete len:498 (-),score=162.79 TRINITY_DN7824_c0_g1_i3:85-1578(-)
MSRYFYVDKNYKGEAVIRGYLKKAKQDGSLSRILSVYTKRYFVLDLSSVTFYYSEGPTQGKRKAMSIEDIEQIKPFAMAPMGNDMRLNFSIYMKQRHFILTADREEEKLRWLYGFAALVPIYRDQRLIDFSLYSEYSFLIPKENPTPPTTARANRTEKNEERKEERKEARQEALPEVRAPKDEPKVVPKSEPKDEQKADIKEEMKADVKTETPRPPVNTRTITQGKQVIKSQVTEVKKMKQDRSLLTIEESMKKAQTQPKDVEAFSLVDQEKVADEGVEIADVEDYRGEGSLMDVRTERMRRGDIVEKKEPQEVKEEIRKDAVEVRSPSPRREPSPPPEVKKAPTPPIVRPQTPPPLVEEPEQELEPEPEQRREPEIQPKVERKQNWESESRQEPEAEPEIKARVKEEVKHFVQEDDDWDAQPTQHTPPSKEQQPSQNGPKATSAKELQKKVENYDDWDEELEHVPPKGTARTQAPAQVTAEKPKVENNYDDWDEDL